MHDRISTSSFITATAACSTPLWEAWATHTTTPWPETIFGLYKTEVIRRRGPWRNLEEVEYATLEWGRLVPSSTIVRTDREYPPGGVRTALLSMPRRSGHGGRTQLTGSPKNPGRFRSSTSLTPNTFSRVHPASTNPPGRLSLNRRSVESCSRFVAAGFCGCGQLLKGPRRIPALASQRSQCLHPVLDSSEDCKDRYRRSDRSRVLRPSRPRAPQPW